MIKYCILWCHLILYWTIMIYIFHWIIIKYQQKIIFKYKFLSSIKKYQYTFFLKKFIENQCPICLESFQIGDTISQIQCSCQTIFHHSCIFRHLSHSVQCPICKFFLD